MEGGARVGWRGRVSMDEFLILRTSRAGSVRRIRGGVGNLVGGPRLSGAGGEENRRGVIKSVFS